MPVHSTNLIFRMIGSASLYFYTLKRVKQVLHSVDYTKIAPNTMAFSTGHSLRSQVYNTISRRPIDTHMCLATHTSEETFVLVYNIPPSLLATFVRTRANLRDRITHTHTHTRLL